jgi:NADP-dependent 3-hydroxy acid dehydrogenase YdfG
MSDPIVVITGVSSGIGAAVAELVSREGVSVVLAARRTDALESDENKILTSPATAREARR